MSIGCVYIITSGYYTIHASLTKISDLESWISTGKCSSIMVNLDFSNCSLRGQIQF